jgi:hypothetical protein
VEALNLGATFGLGSSFITILHRLVFGLGARIIWAWDFECHVPTDVIHMGEVKEVRFDSLLDSP